MMRPNTVLSVFQGAIRAAPRRLDSSVGAASPSASTAPLSAVPMPLSSPWTVARRRRRLPSLQLPCHRHGALRDERTERHRPPCRKRGGVSPPRGLEAIEYRPGARQNGRRFADVGNSRMWENKLLVFLQEEVVQSANGCAIQTMYRSWFHSILPIQRSPIQEVPVSVSIIQWVITSFNCNARIII